MASCVLSKSCPSRPSHVSHLPFPHLPFCCFSFTCSRPCIFLSCHLSSSHHLSSPCLWKPLSLPSRRAFSSHLPVVVTAYDDSGGASRVLGRDHGAVDAGLQSGKVSGSQYFQNIFSSEPRTVGDRLEKNSNVQQPSTPSGSIKQNDIDTNVASMSAREPTEYDFEIYASNSMEGWTPPPPPLPPFGNIFEDYWGEVIGEDYLPKKAERSSLLAYLDSLNAAKPDAGNSPTSSIPFRSSNLRRNRPFEGTRANRPIRSENLRASRPIKEPKPIDTSWSADWPEDSYDIGKEVDKKSSSRSGGTMPVEGDGVGDSRPTQRKIILGNSKLLGPLPGYGVEDAKPAGRNTNFTNGDGGRPAERDIILGDSKSVGPLPGYSDEGAELMERNATLGKDYLSNASGRDDQADANTAERNTLFNRNNLSSSAGRDGKLPEPLPGYGAGVAKPAERNAMLEQSSVSKMADGISAGDIMPIERKGHPGNTESLGPLPGYAIGDKPAGKDTTLGRNMANPTEVDFARYPDHKEGFMNSVPANPNGVSDAKPWDSTTVAGSSCSFNQDLGIGTALGSGSLIDARIGDSVANARSDMGMRASSIEKAQLSGSVADYGPVGDMLAGGRSGNIMSGSKDVLAAKPDGNISSVRPEDKISSDQPMDAAIGHSESFDSRPLTIHTNVHVKPLDSVVDTRGVESRMAAKPMEDSTAFTLERTYVSPGSQSSLPMPAVTAADGQASEVVTQLYEPRVKDIVLGAVISANDQKLDLEIGAEHPGLMLSKDLRRPFLDANLDRLFFKLPSNDDSDKPDGFAVPMGKSLLVEDKTIYNGGIVSGSVVDRGMVITAEVEGRTLGDGRAILSVRPPARRIAWHRVNQLMQVAEAFDVQITQWNDGGLLSYVEGLRAFLPRSELLQRPESAVSLKEYVGRVLTVSINRVEEEAANIVISELKAWTRKQLRLGTLHDATVSKLYPFGMQVEVSNTRVRGFVHVSNMSKEYVKRVADLFKEGEKVKVMLIRGRDSQQIAFSIADLESDRGLIFRDKERVFCEAEEMARKFRESLSADDQQGFGQEIWDTKVEFQEPVIANMNWLHL